ncbi:MAG TPA: hypothetical protein VKA74_12180 [Myxococcota bacterium]|nr:hypothetical protein [Myxococcota bacterium]
MTTSPDEAARPIVMLDELEVRPGMLDPFLDALESDYRPGAEGRGLRLRHVWVTPPLESAAVSTQVVLVWELAGVPGFWRMRSANASSEVADWWRSCERFVSARTRRYAVEAADLEGFARAGRVHA